MAWTNPITFLIGNVLTAAQLNTNLRDNLNQTGVALVTTAGDIVYATGANALSRLGIGTALQLLQTNSVSTAPAWAKAFGYQIQEILPSSSQADFTFIPATYTHLWLVGYLRTTGAGTSEFFGIQFNGDLGANYDWGIGEYLGSVSATPQSSENYGDTAVRAGRACAAGSSANYFSPFEASIIFYSNSANNKQIQTQGGCNIGGTSTTVSTWRGYGNWRSNAAINEVKVFGGGDAFAAGSIVSLYGML